MRDFRGEPVIVTFLYTHCDDTCPPAAQQVKGALNELGRDVPALAIAVEPPRDTAGSARAFLSEQRMLGRMSFVLGERSELEPIWRGYAIQPQSVRAEHQARIVLVDGRGFQRVGFPIDQATPERIATTSNCSKRASRRRARGPLRPGARTRAARARRARARGAARAACGRLSGEAGRGRRDRGTRARRPRRSAHARRGTRAARDAPRCGRCRWTRRPPGRRGRSCRPRCGPTSPRRTPGSTLTSPTNCAAHRSAGWA